MPAHLGISQQFILILGMHRSGTSSLAGSLQQSGLYLGEVHEWNPHNQKGNRENQRVMDLNDAVLVFNNAAWDMPPKLPLKWNEELSVQRDEVIEDFSAEKSGYSAFIGFKDPRSLMTLNYWLDARVEFHFVGTFRHPLAVASSLKARSGMSFDKGLSLWKAYNIKLLAQLELRAFPVLCFDVEAEIYQRDLLAVANLLGLCNADGNLSFFDNDLRHQSVNLVETNIVCDKGLLASCLAIYQRLRGYYSTQAFYSVI